MLWLLPVAEERGKGWMPGEWRHGEKLKDKSPLSKPVKRSEGGGGRMQREPEHDGDRMKQLEIKHVEMQAGWKDTNWDDKLR